MCGDSLAGFNKAKGVKADVPQAVADRNEVLSKELPPERDSNCFRINHHLAILSLYVWEVF